MDNAERERIASMVEEFGRTHIPPKSGIDPPQSPRTIDEWLEDAWTAAVDGAARVVRESGSVGDGVVIRYGENWSDMFEPPSGRNRKWRCKVCGAKGYLHPKETPSLRWWTTDHLNGHEECHICGKILTIRGMSRHRWIHRKGEDR